MTSRVLPPEEWHRLPGEQLSGLLQYAMPEDVRVAVVESGDEIVGHCMILKLTHLEGLWINEEHKNAGVAGALMGRITETAREMARNFVIAGAEDGDDKMLSLMARLGADRLPVSFFTLRLGN